MNSQKATSGVAEWTPGGILEEPIEEASSGGAPEEMTETILKLLYKSQKKCVVSEEIPEKGNETAWWSTTLPQANLLVIRRKQNVDKYLISL